MKLAELRASPGMPFESKTYFGDAIWDKKASRILNFRFVSVGNKTKHICRVNDFKDIEFITKKLNII